MIILQQ